MVEEAERRRRLRRKLFKEVGKCILGDEARPLLEEQPQRAQQHCRVACGIAGSAARAVVREVAVVRGRGGGGARARRTQWQVELLAKLETHQLGQAAPAQIDKLDIGRQSTSPCCFVCRQLALGATLCCS